MPSVHRETFAGLVREQGWSRGAELGVDKGILFGLLLRTCPDLHLIGVDTFPDHERSHRVPGIALTYSDRATLLQTTTHAAADMVPDGSLDFVFIDADHSQAAVVADIATWRSKVRPGGWLGGHDYRAKKFPGVAVAVDAAFGSRVKQWPGTIWGLWL